MWGTAGTDLWAVGVNGNIGHFDGTAWTKSRSGMRRYLARAWGFSAKDVWVVGDTGAILHLVR